MEWLDHGHHCLLITLHHKLSARLCCSIPPHHVIFQSGQEPGLPFSASSSTWPLRQAGEAKIPAFEWPVVGGGGEGKSRLLPKLEDCMMGRDRAACISRSMGELPVERGKQTHGICAATQKTGDEVA